MFRRIGLPISVLTSTMLLCGCGPSEADELQIEEDLGETEVVPEEEAKTYSGGEVAYFVVDQP